MAAITLERTYRRDDAAQDMREDPRLTLARERLQNSRGIFGCLPETQRAAVLSYDGPEVSGSMKSRRRAHDTQQCA